MRATVVGAGSFGTAVAVLLERAGARTTLLCRTREQAEEMERSRVNERYLAGVELPRGLKVRALGGVDGQFRRADLVFIAVPSRGFSEALAEISRQGVERDAAVISCTKGLVAPDGTPPTIALERAFGTQAVACLGGPAHAREMVEAGAGLVCAANSERRAHAVAGLFQRAGVVCEVSADPVGVEFAGCAKNAAALAAGATVKQGYNAAGMAAADIFDEVRALAATFGAKAETFLGRAGLGDLMATALTPSSRNRAAGELLADGVPAAEIPARLGQASEALETVSLLARAIERAGLDAPITAALAQLIAGELPLDRWVALVRAQQPAPARFRPRGFAAWWQRVRHRLRDWFGAPPRRPGLPEPRGYTDER